MKGGSDGLPTHQTPSHSGAHARRRERIGLGRRGSELMGVMVKARLPDVGWFGGRAGRPGRTDAFVSKVLAVKLGHGDTSSGVEVLTFVVRLLLHARRRRGRARLPLGTHGDGRLQHDPHAHHSHTSHGAAQLRPRGSRAGKACVVYQHRDLTSLTLVLLLLLLVLMVLLLLPTPPTLRLLAAFAFIVV